MDSRPFLGDAAVDGEGESASYPSAAKVETDAAEELESSPSNAEADAEALPDFLPPVRSSDAAQFVVPALLCPLGSAVVVVLGPADCSLFASPDAARRLVLLLICGV